MEYTADEIKEYVKEEDAKFIRLAFRDALGIQKNISVMPGELDKVFNGGIPINPVNIAGLSDSDCAEVYLRPDTSTISVLPWRPDRGRVVRMICDMYRSDGTPSKLDTRVMLKDAIKRAADEGIFFKFGSEAEFYFFKLDDEGTPTKIPYDDAGYMDIAPADKGENIRREICLTIEQMGLRPERSHHERGPGQNEIDFHFGDPLVAADHMVTFKMAVSTIAERNGLYADFSPMPLEDKPSNGYHLNIYARDDTDTDVCRYAAAGIMDKIRELTIFLNPTEDSYRRFGHGSAPDKVNWSGKGHKGLIYISENAGMIRTELRSPDALSNPYLAYSLLIDAGLYGIKRRIPLPKELNSVGALPQTKAEAADIASSSVFIKKHVPEEILDLYVR